MLAAYVIGVIGYAIANAVLAVDLSMRFDQRSGRTVDRPPPSPSTREFNLSSEPRASCPQRAQQSATASRATKKAVVAATQQTGNGPPRQSRQMIDEAIVATVRRYDRRLN